LKCLPAPDPTNINWGNLDTSKKSKTIRRLISMVITIALFVILFVVIAKLKVIQDDLYNKTPDVDCTSNLMK